MTGTDPRADVLARADLGRRVPAVLADFLNDQAARLAGIGPELEPLTRAGHEFVLHGGKRLRPAFAYWGYRGAGGQDGEEIIRAVAGLELLHACALIHDDVMDDSDTRRGAVSVHRRFALLHQREGWQGAPDSFGTATAILIGNLCLIWADSMLATCGLPEPALARARSVYDEMRCELMAGQYLDVLEQATAEGGTERALRVARYKAAKYTVERPLHLGAALADAPEAVAAAYSSYGLPLGEAFQLRDDVLGVYGDPAETGKPAGDDLREGKRTVLVSLAVERATPAQAAVVRRLLGDPTLDSDGVAELRNVIDSTGALTEVERMISERTERAEAVLDKAPITSEARDTLTALAAAATTRRV